MKKSMIIIVLLFVFLYSYTVYGAVTKDIPLGWPISSNDGITLDQEIEDDDIETMWDGEITFQSANYDTRDILVFGQNNKFARIMTSLTSTEDDYQTDVVLEADVDSIKYYYVFDETIQPNLTTTADPLELKFLGKTLKITNIDMYVDNKFTAHVGTEYFMDVGDSVEVEGKTVTLENVGEGGSVIVDVDGVKETIGSTSEYVNGIEIKVLETYYETTKAQRSALLLMGKEAVETYKDGDAYIGEDTDDPNWVWNIGNLNSKAATTTSITGEYSGPYIGIENDFVWNDDSDNPAGVGDCIDLPNNYLKICLDNLTVEDNDYTDYIIRYDDEYDLSDIDPGMVSEQVIVMESNHPSKGFSVITWTTPPPGSSPAASLNGIIVLRANLEKNLVEVYTDKTDGTLDKRGDITLSETPLYFASPVDNTDDLKFELYKKEGSVFLDLATETDSVEENMVLELGDDGVNFGGLGKISRVEEYNELTWDSTHIGTKDEDHRTKYGTIIKNPKLNSREDKHVFSIPSEQVFAKVAIRAGAQEIPPEPTDEIEYNIELGEGWNLISIPLILKHKSIGTVMEDIAENVEVIYGYNPLISEKWEVWRRIESTPIEVEPEEHGEVEPEEPKEEEPEEAEPELVNTLLTIEPGKAYWIKINEPCVLNVKGTIDIKNGDAPGTIPTFNVYEGWNLIGYYGTKDETASITLQNIDGKYSAIWTLFQDNIQSLQGTLKGLNFEKQLQRTHGYWIYLKEDGVIVPTS